MFLKSRFGNFAPLILYITIHWYRCYCLTYVFASPHIFKAVILSTRCANAHSRSKSWLKQKHFLSHVSAEGRKLLWVTRKVLHSPCFTVQVWGEESNIDVRSICIWIFQVVILKCIWVKEKGEINMRFGGWVTTEGEDRLAQASL
mgnify:CR=1 FL=1